jgi:hypothetical protein
MKVAINSCFGGFGLPPEALVRLYELGCKEIATPVAEYFGDDEKARYNSLIDWRKYKAMKSVDDNAFQSMFTNVFSNDEQFILYERANSESLCQFRSNPLLIQVIEEFTEAGKKVSRRCSNVVVIEIPDDVEWHIAEYDGYEHVAENHRTWPSDQG